MALTKITSDVIGTGAVTSDHLASGAVTHSSLSNITTDNVSEGSTNVYYTDTRARSSVSVTGGNLSYDSGTGVIQLTTDQIRTAVSGGTGVSISAGEISIGQDVATSSTPTFGNITTTGYIAGPATFTIDPAAVGNNTGTVVIAGNLQVDGTTTTINSTTMEVDDLNITLASGAANAAAANGAGITVDGASATITYDGTNDEWDFNKSINLNGDITLTEGDKIKTSESSGGSHLLLRSDNLGVTSNSMSLVGLNDILIGAKSNNSGTGNIYFGVGAENKASGSGWTDTLTILESGNVGIGTNNPYTLLELSSIDPIIRMTDSNGVADKSIYEMRAIGASGYESLEFRSVNDANSVYNKLLVLKHGGNVGIGTDQPNQLLHLDNSTNTTDDAIIRILSGNAGLSGIYLGDPDYGSISRIRHDHSDDTLQFWSSNVAGTSSLQRMTIVPGGNVGIGITDPVARLDVTGTTTNYPTVYDYLYATGEGIRVYGEESALDLVGEDTGGHASSILIRNENEGFGIFNVPDDDTLRIRSFNVTADDFYIHSSGGNVSNLTDILTLEKTGNVGIGTDSPAQKLEVRGNGAKTQFTRSGSTGTLVEFYSGASAAGGIQSQSTGLGISGGTGENHVFIDTSGNVGIGESSPTEKLTVNGAILASGALQDDRTSTAAIDFSSGVTRFVSYGASGTGGEFAFRTASGGASSTERMRITAGGATRIVAGNSLELQNAAGNNEAVIRCDGAGTNTDLRFDTGGSERMRIDTSGDLRVGSSSLGFHFDISTQLFSTNFGAGGNLTLACTNNSGTGNGGEIFLGGSSRGDSFRNVISFRTGSSSETMRITSNGSVFIGTTSEPNGSTGGAGFSIDNNDRANFICATTGTGNLELIEFRNPNGTVGDIKSNGTSTSYNTSSDGRLKDVTGKARGLEVIDKLNPVSYNWKTDNKAGEGLIAQEVIHLVPDAISKNNKTDYYQMDYSKLVVHLIAGMKEQQTIIDDLKSRIETLEG